MNVLRNQRAKVLFANVALGQKTPGEIDFDITFRDSQDVHLFEEKVSRVLCLPRSTLIVKLYTCYTRSCTAKKSSAGVSGLVQVSCLHSIPSEDNYPL